MSRIEWIDFCRGVCMLMILWFHTEVYYLGDCVIPYAMYVENALMGFFFLSGYLCFPYNGSGHDLRKSVTGIIRRLLVPYLVITPFLQVGKALPTGEPIDVGEMLLRILSGQASWFVAALIVCRLYIACVSRLRSFLFTLVACTFPFLLMCIDADYIPVPTLDVSALSVFFMFCGHLFRRYEARFLMGSSRSFMWVFCPSVLFFIFLKVLEFHYDINMMVCPILIDSMGLFTVDTLLGCILLTSFVRRFLSGGCRVSYAFQWVGRHSLVYYFICGGVPKMVAIAMQRTTDVAYGYMPIAFVLVCLLSTGITWGLYRSRLFRVYVLGVA